MKKGTVVGTGWSYRNKKIQDTKTDFGIIISSTPYNAFWLVETIKQRNGKWIQDYHEDFTDVVSVLWSSGEISDHPILNLYEVSKL
tara:strand:+ start:1864 stop:2121 length:258 start_codon:yes stop_codon:yes gene_type:complete